MGDGGGDESYEAPEEHDLTRQHQRMTGRRCHEIRKTANREHETPGALPPPLSQPWSQSRPEERAPGDHPQDPRFGCELKKIVVSILMSGPPSAIVAPIVVADVLIEPAGT